MNRNPSIDYQSILKNYCSSNEINSFLKTIDDKPVSSLIKNNYQNQDDSIYSSLIKDETFKDLYRFDKDKYQAGKSIEHFGGAYYILDPSSYILTTYLAKIIPSNFVGLDMCCAPGGKTISLLNQRNDGIILANDISYLRQLESIKNFERLGINTVLTTSIDPLLFDFKECFDFIILDAPCSGNGMIRKDKDVISDYSLEKVNRLCKIQKNLLEKSYSLLKRGGFILYSTCSYNTQENENQIEFFLNQHSDCTLLPLTIPYLIKGKNSIGFHMVSGNFDGEGMFFTLIQKNGGDINPLTPLNKGKSESIVFNYKDNSFIVKNIYKEFLNLNLLSLGIKEFDKSDHPKCLYAHSFCKTNSDIDTLELSEIDAKKYIKGEQIKTTHKKNGILILTYKNYKLGFGKCLNGVIKNYLPKNLRISL